VNPAPVIVLGNEKSGTTAIAALLAEHADRSVTLDIPALFGRRAEPLLSGERDFDRALRGLRFEFSRDVIKEPTLTWLYPQLRRSLPEARFVLIVRDPRSNVRSILNRVGLPGDLQRLTRDQRASIPRNWRWHFDRPDLLGLAPGGYVELAAARWNRAADTHLHDPDEVGLVRYEDFLADKAGFIAALAERVGLPHRRDVSAVVDRQFQSRGDRAVSWEAFFGEQNLAAIERTCEARMDELGYERRTSG
jgi:hypothetical protein